ncbi:MAG: hypothetical protein ACOVSR_03360 [Bacteroidia bacterium]
MNKKIWYLYIAFMLEILFIFYVKNVFEFIVSPLIIIGSGAFLAIFPYFLQRENKDSFIEENSNNISNSNENLKSLVALFLALTVSTIVIVNYKINKYPINVNESDIIPFIDEIFVKRFMNNEVIYAPYTGFNYGTFTPGYLPLHWFPFVISNVLNINYQWVVVIVFLLACAIYTLVLFKNIQQKEWLLINCALPFILLFTIYYKNGKTAVQSIEIMIMGYYLILATLLFSSNVILKAVGLILPFLSRYSFLFWLPVYFYNLLRNNFKKFLLVSVLFGVMILLFFVIPFVLPIPEMLKTFNANYTTSILGEWKGQSWQAPTDRPFQLFQGIGLASWFYQFGSGSLLERIELNKNALFLFSILSSLTIILLQSKIRKTISANLFSLLALKFMLTIFYAFIMVPYDYLNWVPLVVSIVILSRINHPSLNPKQY